MPSMQSKPGPEHTPHASESRSNWVFLAFLAIAGFFLFTEHRAHLLGVLPFLLLLACPLLHLFHHGQHGGDPGASGHDHNTQGEDK